MLLKQELQGGEAGDGEAETENGVITQLIKEQLLAASQYELFSILFHLMVEVCGKMEEPNRKHLLSMNRFFFSPKDNFKFPGERRGGIHWFQKAWCLRQDIANQLKDEAGALQCFDERTRMLPMSELWALMDMYQADEQHLSVEICKITEERQLSVNKIKDQ